MARKPSSRPEPPSRRGDPPGWRGSLPLGRSRPRGLGWSQRARGGEWARDRWDASPFRGRPDPREGGAGRPAGDPLHDRGRGEGPPGDGIGRYRPHRRIGGAGPPAPEIGESDRGRFLLGERGPVLDHSPGPLRAAHQLDRSERQVRLSVPGTGRTRADRHHHRPHLPPGGEGGILDGRRRPDRGPSLVGVARLRLPLPWDGGTLPAEYRGGGGSARSHRLEPVKKKPPPRARPRPRKEAPPRYQVGNKAEVARFFGVALNTIEKWVA